MKQVRMSVFETNSSSTHSLTIVTAEEYNKWKDGKLAYNRDSEELVPLPVKTDDDEYESEDVQSYDAYENCDDCLETFMQSFTTPSGDNMVAFGKYGHD
jgi:hypothetical protein